MSTTDHIRTMLRAGADPETIAIEVGCTKHRVMVVRWHMRNPGRKSELARDWRKRDAARLETLRERDRQRYREKAEEYAKLAADNAELTKRLREMEKKLARHMRPARKRTAPKMIMGPAHWYG